MLTEVSRPGRYPSRKLTEFTGREDDSRLIDAWDPPEAENEDIGFYAYSPYECSDAMKAVLADPGAEYCLRPRFWSESDIQACYGTAFSKFKPSRPREGYVCVIVRDSAQNGPETSWSRGNSSEQIRMIRVPALFSKKYRQAASSSQTA